MFTYPTIQDKLFFEMTPLIPSCVFSPDSGSFMPYALLRMAEIHGIGVVLDVTAFENKPDTTGGEDFLKTDDLMAVSINLDPEHCKDNYTFVCNSSDRCFLFTNGECIAEQTCERRSGEDERGDYWAVSITLSPDKLKELFGISTLDSVKVVRANMFKAKLDQPHRHFGAVAPFARAYDLFCSENLADFQVLPM